MRRLDQEGVNSTLVGEAYAPCLLTYAHQLVWVLRAKGYCVNAPDKGSIRPSISREIRERNRLPINIAKYTFEAPGLRQGAG